MYTCCPICKTNFNVTEAQLQVAQGKVRCGSCKNVFNARQHIHYSPSKPVQTTTPLSADAFKQPLQKKTFTTPSNPLSKKDRSQEKQTPATKRNTNKPISEIDAIFNALDTQLSSGTYLDIAKSNEPDIREAEFNDIFDDNEAKDIDNNPPSTKTSDIFLNPPPNKNITDDEPDLNLYEEDIDNTPAERTDSLHQSNQTTPAIDKGDLALQQTLDSIAANNFTPKPKPAIKPQKAGKQQHAFDFINLPDEPDLSSEAEEQLAAVNKPFKMPPTNKLVTKTENDDLHQAIDNIIKVNNSIPTPYEVNDADHFVIEVQNEPDVELVDENDIDKLFASTDSLKISDLKFDKIRTPSSENNLDIEDNNDGALNINISLDTPDNEVSTRDVQTSIDSDLAFEAHDEFSKDDFDEPSYEQQINAIDTHDSDIIDLETEFDSPDIDEEIVLSSNDLDNAVPHRLRDSVASFEAQPASIKKRFFYSIGIIVLIALGGLQLVLFKSTAIANTLPTLQPLLLSMCQKLPCRYTGNHNRKQIKIISRDVRLHPKIKGALLISATIANQASYTQPYPTILLKFTDLTGATVAQRYFQPSEYLGLLNKPFALMPSRKPIQLNIEILDPGSEAINFQFFFL